MTCTNPRSYTVHVHTLHNICKLVLKPQDARRVNNSMMKASLLTLGLKRNNFLLLYEYLYFSLPPPSLALFPRWSTKQYCYLIGVDQCRCRRSSDVFSFISILFCLRRPPRLTKAASNDGSRHFHWNERFLWKLDAVIMSLYNLCAFYILRAVRLALHRLMSLLSYIPEYYTGWNITMDLHFM